jgi:flagellar biosynthesis/type III secretory pathway protein FliH
MTIAEQLIEEGRQKGREEAREEAREEGRKEGRIDILRRALMGKFKLQTLDPAYEACLHAATPEAFDRYLKRALIADSLAAIFAD